MKEVFYSDLVKTGFRYLRTILAPYIVQQMTRVYRGDYRDEIEQVAHNEEHIKYDGLDDEFMDSLDVQACLKVIRYRFDEVFSAKLSLDERTHVSNLIHIRNVVSHEGAADLDQHTAEISIDAMRLLASAIDPDMTDELTELYKEVRSYSEFTDKQTIEIENMISQSRDLIQNKEGILKYLDTEFIQRTNSTKKIVFEGSTREYPVYRIRLDAPFLYYNDQNDRIATWMTSYEEENPDSKLTELDPSIYNHIIEDFIVSSNPESIKKTQMNIDLVGQLEAGVTLMDGRVVDGNRRFTCLRRLQRKSDQPLYFETVVLDLDIAKDRKQIKLIELNLQHGRDEKVDYDLVDNSIGTYRTILEEKLMTVEEYAKACDEQPASIRKKLNIAELMIEFLEYINCPGQYHIAREKNIYSVFDELIPNLNKEKTFEGKEALKKYAFTNISTGAFKDQRSFNRDIKTLIQNDRLSSFIEKQKPIIEKVKQQLDTSIHSDEDFNTYQENNVVESAELDARRRQELTRLSNEKSITKPIEQITKIKDMVENFDMRHIDQLSAKERQHLCSEMESIQNMLTAFKNKLGE